MVYELKTEYGDRGYVVEYLASNTSEYCKSWLLLPAENLWPEWLRGILYLICMFYFFLGVAISSDIFMNSIEVLTSKKRTVKQWDPEKNEMKEVEVFIWNETVANLTLMALGSSAPEILLATFESIGSLGVDNSDKDSLGTFTIIGSAAFNLLIITSVCVVSVSGDEPKAIKEFGVFLLTSAWSLWAYIWLLLVVQYISPGVVDPWEAWVTLLYMPVFVFLAYATDNGWWRHKCCIKKNEVDAQEPKQMVSKEYNKMQWIKDSGLGKLLGLHQQDYLISNVCRKCMCIMHTIPSVVIKDLIVFSIDNNLIIVYTAFPFKCHFFSLFYYL